MKSVSVCVEVERFLSQSKGHFIAGEYMAENHGRTFDVINPATEEILVKVEHASDNVIHQAVASASKAFYHDWKSVSPYQRGQLLNRFADLIEKYGEELAQLETLSSGKNIQLSRMFEVGQSAVFLRYFAGWTTKIQGETISPSLPSMAGEKYSAMTFREPVGVVTGIIPWNFSVMIAIWKIGAALSTGCTIILKPSEFTPLTLLRLAEIAIEAGIPAGTVNVVNGNGDIGQKLISHPDVAKVSFTGSVPTGLKVGAQAMSSGLTRVSLELGGKNAAALLEDVNVDDAVTGLIQTGYVHQGQVCAAPERVYVHRSRFDDVVGKMCERLSLLNISDPLDEQAHFGPLTSKAHFDKVMQFFSIASAESQILFGGKAIDRTGYYVEPTIVVANGPDDRLLKEEVFGPVLCFLPYDTDEELVSLINNSEFGLTASIWTNDLSRAFRLIPQIEAGTVWVNMHTFLDPAVPFGGTKSSGIGREFGKEFINDYTELKSVMIRY